MPSQHVSKVSQMTDISVIVVYNLRLYLHLNYN